MVVFLGRFLVRVEFYHVVFNHGAILPGYTLQALVYDILPPNTATIDYDIGLEKISANGQFFIGVQIAVSLS